MLIIVKYYLTLLSIVVFVCISVFCVLRSGALARAFAAKYHDVGRNANFRTLISGE